MTKGLKIVFLFFSLNGTLHSSAALNDSLQKIYDGLPKDTHLINRIYKDVKNIRNSGNYDETRGILWKNKNWILKNKSVRHQGQWYLQIGLTNDFDGYYDSAIHFYNKAIPVFKSINSRYYHAYSYLNLGVVNLFKGDNKSALKALITGLQLTEKYGLKEMNKTIQVNLGGIYFNMGDYKKSYKHFKQRLAYDTRDDSTALISCFYNMGMLHFIWEHFDSSQYYANRSYEISEKLKDKMGMADAKSLIGMSNRKLGNYKEALSAYNEMLFLKRKNDALVSYEAYLNISLLYAVMKDKRRALAYSDTSMMIVSRSNSRERRAKVLRSRAQVFNEFKEYEKAYDALFRYIELNDSIFSDENTKEIENMKAEFDIQQKANEVKQEEKIKREKEKARSDAEAEAKDKRNKTILFSGGIVLVLIIIFALIVYRRFQVTKKQNRIIELQKKEVMHQKEMVEEKQKEIVDSINYAKRLQEAILPPMKTVKQYLGESFILYKPKDIVAGDFYFLDPIDENKIVFAAADCTGHGVPGAMVSVVCSNALNRAVKEFGITDPGKILDKVRELVTETFSKSESEVKDGMDISLCVYDRSTKKLGWAGANNPLWIVKRDEGQGTREERQMTGLNPLSLAPRPLSPDSNPSSFAPCPFSLTEIKPDKQPVGVYSDSHPFTSHFLQLNTGDSIYIFTDGYADQFGGEKKKKFRASSMKQLILSIQDQDMNQQMETMGREFENWKGKLEQIDDVCVIGVRI